MGALSFLCVSLYFRETLRRPAGGAGRLRVSWSAASPLAFLKLFRAGGSLASLTLVSTISELCDGTHEIDRHYGIEVARMSLTQDGVYNSLRGLSSVLGGRLVQPVLGALSNRRR